MRLIWRCSHRHCWQTRVRVDVTSRRSEGGFHRNKCYPGFIWRWLKDVSAARFTVFLHIWPLRWDLREQRGRSASRLCVCGRECDCGPTASVRLNLYKLTKQWLPVIQKTPHQCVSLTDIKFMMLLWLFCGFLTVKWKLNVKHLYICELKKKKRSSKVLFTLQNWSRSFPLNSFDSFVRSAQQTKCLTPCRPKEGSDCQKNLDTQICQDHQISLKRNPTSWHRMLKLLIPKFCM